MTGEHIWSDWTKKFLVTPVSRTEQARNFVDKDGNPIPDVPLHIRPGAVHRRQARIVCRECNNGWMRAIVDAARPSAEMLITGQVIKLGSQEQAALANWMALSSIIVNRETRSRHKLPDADIKYMYEHHAVPPNNWHIDIGYYFYRQASDFSDNLLALSFRNTITGEYKTSFVAHSTATILGHLYIKFYRAEPVDPRFPSGDPFPRNLHSPWLTPLWPRLFPIIEFPPAPNRFIPGALRPKSPSGNIKRDYKVFEA